MARSSVVRTATRFVSGAENHPPGKMNPTTPTVTRSSANVRRVRPHSHHSTKADAASQASRKPNKDTVRAQAAAEAASAVSSPKKKSKSVQAVSDAVKLPRNALAEVPLEYQQDILKGFRSSLMFTQAHTRTQCFDRPVHSENLPASIDLTITTDRAVHMPSHTLAVYTASSAASAPASTLSLPPRTLANPRRLENQPATRVHLYPVHAPILTTACSNLPESILPETEVAPAYARALTTPLVPFAVSHAESFGHVFAYLYHHSPAYLLSSLLPPSSSSTSPAIAPLSSTVLDTSIDTTPLRRAHASALAAHYDVASLLSRANTLTGVWRNVQQLGIHDQGMWRAMDVAWDVLFRALVLKGHIKVEDGVAETIGVKVEWREETQTPTPAATPTPFN